MGNTSDFNKDNISKQRTFQPNHENINLSKMFILFLLLKRLSQVIRSELL